jgi:hypothetical protein
MGIWMNALWMDSFSHFVEFFKFSVCFAVLGIESRFSGLINKLSTPELHPQPPPPSFKCILRQGLAKFEAGLKLM